MADISSVLEHSKDLEILVFKHDPHYNSFLKATEIVKQFIIERGLIIYGGMAIDMALRLKGDKIYPDDAKPDLDFYSPNSVEDSYDLADILYKAGFKESRSINAFHVGTSKVDIVDNNFVADISYVPKDVFDLLPTLTYAGMRIIHPHFQYIDTHSALAFPFDNPPSEVIFARWEKDIKRYNKLVEYYPLPEATQSLESRPVETTHTKYVLAGFAAYAAIYTWFVQKYGVSGQSKLISAKFEANDASIKFESLNNEIEFVHFDMEKATKEISGSNSVKFFDPYFTLFPAHAEVEKDGKKYTIYSTHNKLLSVNSIQINGHPLRVCNAQYLLKYFLGNYIRHKPTPKLADTYLARYNSLLEMIKIAEASEIGLVPNEPLSPTVTTYGADNIGEGSRVNISRLRQAIYGEKQLNTPLHYFPERSWNKGLPHPDFDYESSEFFRRSGHERSADHDK